MAITGESSSAVAVSNNDKPVVVRVKRKISQSRLDAFWLEINERPLKRPLLDFEKLSISDSAGKDEFKAKKVFVQHVETLNTAEATIDIVQSFVPTSADALDGKTKSEERRRAFKKENLQRHDQHISKARQKQEELAKNARFEQIWRSRKGNNDEMHEKEIREMCHFYDVVRVDVEGRSNEGQKQEDISLEDQNLLSSYLPLLREFLPSHAAEIESEIQAKMSEKDDYVYDYYTVNDDVKVDDDGSNPFPLVQVDDEDYYDGPDESEYDSEDSNAENNPRNDYPEEMSGEEEEAEEEDEEAEEEEEEEEGAESKVSDESEDLGEDGDINVFSDPDLLHDDDLYYDDFNDNGDDNDEDDDGKDWRWSYR